MPRAKVETPNEQAAPPTPRRFELEAIYAWPKKPLDVPGKSSASSVSRRQDAPRKGGHRMYLIPQLRAIRVEFYGPGDTEPKPGGVRYLSESAVMSWTPVEPL